MKTLGRIFVILAVFALVMGVTYVLVNAGSSGGSANVPQFDRPGFDDGDRPEFPNGERNEFGGEGGGGIGWIFELIKNTVVVGIIVALIVVPKNWIRKSKRTIAAANE